MHGSAIPLNAAAFLPTVAGTPWHIRSATTTAVSGAWEMLAVFL